MRAIVFANGEFRDSHQFPPLEDGDLVIAADGGSRHCLSLNIIPTLLIGDLDSSDQKLVAHWKSVGVEVIEYPTEKDQTDLELALLLAQERGAAEILVYGAVGGRLDMTFGNLILLAHPQLDVPTTLICEQEEVHLLRPGSSVTLEGSTGDTLSLLPLQPGGSLVSASGVQYPLNHEKLEVGLTRGISNQLIQPTAEISLFSGYLAVIHTRRSLPEEVNNE